ncbi:STAS domain-containing protein [Streptomyces beigongshangae]|uniref:STAS domain-containing protein n=1 Tax=Streptomyces beigongshangae TaxID=2841597 RepID=UPI001C852EBB|nr:STAS domain-containing protein [Streptomyces sp. REN17]
MSGQDPPRLQVHQAEQRHGGMLVSLTGELDVQTSLAIREAIIRIALPRTTRYLLLDLSGLTYCATGGLYSLLGMTDALEVVGVSVQIVRISTAVQAVVRTSEQLTRLPLTAAATGPDTGASWPHH